MQNFGFPDIPLLLFTGLPATLCSLFNISQDIRLYFCLSTEQEEQGDIVYAAGRICILYLPILG